MTIVVKQGDTHDISWDVNASLDGCTVELHARRVSIGGTWGDLEVLDSSINESTVTHTLTGELEVGNYLVELEITRAGKITTAPTSGFERLVVTPALG